jgi:hypothetical protein
MKNIKILNTLVVILLISTLFFAWLSVSYNSKIQRLENERAVQTSNNKIMSFTKLFMSKVLNGSSEVSFEDRLQLENSAKELGDSEILNSWQDFTKSKTSADVEKNFYNLLQLLLNKIAI